jgi:hypothetical protein
MVLRRDVPLMDSSSSSLREDPANSLHTWIGDSSYVIISILVIFKERQTNEKFTTEQNKERKYSARNHQLMFYHLLSYSFEKVLL